MENKKSYKHKSKFLGIPLKTLTILCLIFGSVGAAFIGRYLMQIPTSPLVVTENEYKIEVYDDLALQIPTVTVVWQNTVFEGDLLGVSIKSASMYLIGPYVDGTETIYVTAEFEGLTTGCTAWVEHYEDQWLRYEAGEVFTYLEFNHIREFRICVDMNELAAGSYTGLIVNLIGGDNP